MRTICALGLALGAFLITSGDVPALSAVAPRTDVGHGLSIAVLPGWYVSHRRFTPCSDPAERFSLIGPGQILTIEERRRPVPAELTRRPRHFTVHGKPTPLECCAIPGRRGWVVHFGDHGRAFYAYLYPGHTTPRMLLRALDSFEARVAPR